MHFPVSLYTLYIERKITVSRSDLSLASIQALCDDLRKRFSDGKTDRKELLRTCLSIEEVLLQYRDRFGEETAVELRTFRSRTKLTVRLLVACDRFNPFSGQEGVLRSLHSAADVAAPVWRYHANAFDASAASGQNEIQYRIVCVHPLSPLPKMLISLALCFLGAGAMRLIFGAASCEDFARSFLLPLANAYTGVLNVMAILLIFFSLPLCIVQYGNAAAFHKAAGKTFLRFVSLMVGGVLASAAVTLFVFGFDSAGTRDSVIAPIYSVLLSFVPSDIISPFLTFNSMGVMIIGCMFGFSFLAMGEQSKPLVTAFDRCNLVAVLTNNYFARFAHLYLGIMVAFYTLSGAVSLTADYLWFAVSIVAACLIFVLAMAAYLCLRLRVPFFGFLRRLMPSFMITMSGAGVGASFIVLFNEITDSGVDIPYNGMATNLGAIFCKPLYGFFLAASGMLAVHLTGTLTPVVAVQIVLLALVLPAAIPNIQGGASSVIVLMLTQLGMSTATAEIFLTINTLLQFIIVPCNIFILQCAVILQARKENHLDLQKLRTVA